jgi:peptidoglycan/xylan/chitin deacetylase (PgdA/CDA1 family)
MRAHATGWTGRFVAALGLAALLLGACAPTAKVSEGRRAATVAADPASPPPGLAGRQWDRIPTNAKVVALTFDAGANADGVPSILATLRQQHVPATFFLTGDFVKAFPARARDIAAAGERVGDHSVSHPYFAQLTDAQIRAQVVDAQAQIKASAGADPWPWFRFPYGDHDAHTIAVVNSVGFVPVGWTVDTLGWEGTSGGISVATVVSRVLGALQPGEIVLMHCGSNPTDHSTLDAAALPQVISELRARGYRFVTVDALMGLGYTISTSDGGAHSFGAPWYGSMAGKLVAGVRVVAIAGDPATGGYWLAKSDGGVEAFNAPWYGSLRGRLPTGVQVTGAAGR